MINFIFGFVVAVAISALIPAAGVWMNEKLLAAIAWAKSHIGTRKDAS